MKLRVVKSLRLSGTAKAPLAAEAVYIEKDVIDVTPQEARALSDLFATHFAAAEAGSDWPLASPAQKPVRG